jgi:tRNA(Ile)-lysidine synthase
MAHLNHGLRPEADGDAAFVFETAASWQIPFISEKINVAEVAETLQLSLEAAGRLVRYQFLARQAAAVGATAVVVAHHADDQAETVLLHLLRGSGTAGLRGMLPVGRVPGAEDLALIRPFLNITRAEIEAYCTRHGLKSRQDKSNDDVQFTRNRIRHELLPLLRTYNPQISARLQQLAIIIADDYAAQEATFNQIWPELLHGQADEWLILDRQLFGEQPAAWQRLALRRVVEQLRPFHTEIGFQTIEQARSLILKNKSSTAISLPGGLIMQVEAQEIVFGDATARQFAIDPQLDGRRPVQLLVPGQVDLANGWRIIAKLRADVALEAVRQNDDPWQVFVALEEGGPLWLRPSLPGERFQPLGMKGHSQSIQDLLGDRKVARGKRPLWPIVVTSEHPVWIVGQHLDERVRVTEKTRRVVQLTCFPNAEG